MIVRLALLAILSVPLESLPLREAAASAPSWLRFRYEDAIVVGRSELIVVGRIVPGSIKYVPHVHKDSGGVSGHHDVSLHVTETLHGKVEGTPLSITIHYGLTPREHLDGTIQIRDTGNSVMSLRPFVEDASRDHLWFLRRRSGIYGEKPGVGKYGVADPEDIALARLKLYYMAYREKDPEAAVAREVKRTPEVKERAQRYFDHREVERIRAVRDVDERLRRLTPYVLAQQNWNGKSEALGGFIESGEKGARALIALWPRIADLFLQDETLRALGKIRHASAVPFLMDRLRKAYLLFSREGVESKWWDDSSPRGKKWKDAYGKALYSVRSLGQIGDPRARDLIEQVRAQWESQRKRLSQMSEACDTALENLDRR